jgi:DegV family protein with EDD domain
MSFKIVTDSTANLSVEYCTKNDVSVISLFYILNGQENTAYDEHNPNSLDEFYDKLKQKPRASTSCANEDSYYKVFEDAYKKGQEVLYIGFSSGVSATYSSPLLAKNMILDTYPDAKIYCVDTLTGSFGQGHFIMKVVQMRNEGKSVEDCFNYVTQERFKMRTFVTVDDLYFLYQGGRIPALTYKIGTLVKIKPIIEVNTEGKLVSVNKVLS